MEKKKFIVCGTYSYVEGFFPEVRSRPFNQILDLGSSWPEGDAEEKLKDLFPRATIRVASTTPYK